MPIPPRELFSVAECATFLKIPIEHVIELINRGLLILAVTKKSVTQGLSIRAKYSDGFCGPEELVPDYLYFNLYLNESEYLRKDDKQISIEKFLNLDSGEEYSLCFQGQDEWLTVPLDEVVVTQRAIDRLVQSKAPGKAPNEAVIGIKGKNSMVRTIYALSEALSGGLSGVMQQDATSIVDKLEKFYNSEITKLNPKERSNYEFKPPVKPDTLARYLKQAQEICYEFIDFKEDLPRK